MSLAFSLLLVVGCTSGPAADGKEPLDSEVDTASGDTADTADTGSDTAGDAGGDTADSGPDPATLDQDGDGFTPLDGDCDDALPHVYPGAPDYCDGLDQDCDGEPIPDGSCSLRGDGRSMWSWLVEAQDGTEGWLHGPVGDQDGDGLAELGFETSVSGQSHDGVRVGSLFGSDWALRPAIGAFPTRSYSMAGSRYILPDQQFAGDVDGEPELLVDASCIVASGRAVIGGVALLSEVAGPCLSLGHDDWAMIRAVANVAGDERAELAVQVPNLTLTADSIAIIAGFDIPYDDPSKW